MGKRRNNVKQGHLGPAFHHHLEYLETVEQFATTGKAKTQGRAISVNSGLFITPEDDDKYSAMLRDMVLVDAALAQVARSSIKYKVTAKTLVDVAERYTGQLAEISSGLPMRLPHKWCTIIIEGLTGGDIIITAQEQVAENNKLYPELGLSRGETFICLNIMAFAPPNKLSHFPVEIHATHNRTHNDTTMIFAAAGDVEQTEQGRRTLELIWTSFVVWHHQFHLQAMLREEVPGVRPSKHYQPARLRKRHEHPQFEHTIIRMEIDAPESNPTGLSMVQPHKRLHQVRGFWRRYKKSGKKVWVKPHWRGDEKLGVVRRDVELIAHDEVSDVDADQ